MARRRRDLKPRGRDTDSPVDDPNEVGEIRVPPAPPRPLVLDELNDDLATDSPALPDPELPSVPARSVRGGTSKAAKERAKTAVERRVVVLGSQRKLTKKDERRLSDWRGENHGRCLDATVQAGIAAARRRFGHRGVFQGRETQQLVMGIPVPAIAFEYLLQQDIFPLSVVFHLVGKKKSMKSGLLAEFMRWFDLAGGFGVLNEAETKFSPDWYESIMRPDAFARLQLNRCDSLEDWMQRLTFDLDTYKKIMEGTAKEPGPGRTFPVLFGVDSIMGKMSEEAQAAIVRDGAPGRGFPVEALKLTRYLATMPQWLDDWPFAVVLVNHLKMVTNPDTGHDERSMPGGVRTQFQESFELEMRRASPWQLESAEFDGHTVEIRCMESGLGNASRAIRTRVLWWEEPDEKTGALQQKTVWDWDWALAHLLHTIIKGDRNVRLRAHLKAEEFHMDFNSPTAMGATAWSRTLDVPEKDPLLWHEMGALIRERPEVQELLRRALRIKRRPFFKGDYLAELDDLARESMP